MKSKVKKKKDDSENFDYMKTNKDNIKNVIRDANLLNTINNIVIRTNKIVIHSYNFLKLYLLDLYKNNKAFPLVDKEFICDIFKVVTKRKCGSGGYTEEKMPEQQKILQKFYNEHYKSTTNDKEILYYDKMAYILAYEAIDMETNINNNISEHFIQHMNKFVNVSFDLDGKLKEIDLTIKDKQERKDKKKLVYDELKKIKTDIISFGDFVSDKKYHVWIKEQKQHIIPNKNVFDKDSIMYDVKSNTQDYLKSFIYLGIQIEKFYDKEDTDNHMIRLFNILPLRTNIIPKNIVFDTCGLIQNLLGDESTTKHLQNYKKGDNQFTLWNRLFKLNKKVFKKNKYSFHNMIRTDGISICILFVRNDMNGKPLKKCPKNMNKEEEDLRYIEKAVWTDDMKKKKIVCADPNMADLIYCGSKTNDELTTFRYTQNQRRLETRTKKYNKIIDTMNKETKINNMTIKELETELSKHNSKTNDYEKFKKYLVEKNKLNITLFNHYEQLFFRKFKLNRFINTQKSESKMIHNFTEKFGKPKDTIFIMGDYDKNEHMKGVEPTICKKFRRIFRNAGFETYLINEFRTSKLCNCCHNELETFLYRESKKPKDIKKNKKILVNGLLHHTDVKPECEIIHNRDKNAVQNMLYIVETLKTTGKRPEKYSRSSSA